MPKKDSPKDGPRSWGSISRRELLRLSPVVALGVIAIPKLQDKLLGDGIGFSDRAAGTLFRRHHRAQTFADRDVVPFEKFPYNGYDEIDPEVDLDAWRLEVTGLVQKPGEYTIQQLQALPKLTQSTRHVCVEGWDAIGNFAGTRISDFLTIVGADPKARFLAVQCADDYYESIDMESALHPQSLLCYEMYGKPIDRGHGAPLRLQLPTKLGYKQAKYITKLEVTNVLKPERGYWEDQGYSWYGGL